MTGGVQKQGKSWTNLDSTELMVYKEEDFANRKKWKLLDSARLPSATRGFKAASLNNSIFLFGEKYFN